MRQPTASLLLAGFISLVSSAVPAIAQPGPAPVPAAVEQRLAAQNALFNEWYETELKLSPERATAYGDYRYNALLSDRSLEAVQYRHAVGESFAGRLRAISTDGFSEQDKLSHELMLRVLAQRNADFVLKEYEMPVDQMNGVHTDLADLPLAVPLDTVQHYEDYIARLRQIPRVLDQTVELMRTGMRDHLMPVRFLLEKVPDQCQGIIDKDPFLLPTHKFPASFTAEEQSRLTAEVSAAVNEAVLPAYRSFAEFVKKDYSQQGRIKLAVTSLPDGERRYQNDIAGRTTTHMTPQQIHELGLREVARIEGEMDALAKAAGYPDREAFGKAIDANPKYVPASSDAILDDFRHYIAQMQPKLPMLFTVLPKSPVTVEAIPSFQAAAATHYVAGTPDGKRPGRVVVATSDFSHRSLIDDEAIAYHEGIPGHHMQISVAQELTGLPKFRQHNLGYNAYVEGWALYAEQLGKDIGFYQDPPSDYGRLRSELFRAVRLVVDTGIHEMGWSRQQVVDYMRKANCVDEPTIQSETDRYIAWPAQALSYKLGQLKIRELRDRAQKQLGPKFDLRTFHDEILSGGTLPLDLLDQRVQSWIDGQK
jgi:uncharacterized protein (DUF885 family)